MLFSFVIVNFVWKANEGWEESIVLLISVLWCCFNWWWVRGLGWGRESYLVPGEVASISSWDLRQSNKPDTFWRVVSTGNFSFFLFHIFFPWKFIKNLDLPLSSITFKVNSHADNNFCIFILNIIQYEIISRGSSHKS